MAKKKSINIIIDTQNGQNQKLDKLYKYHIIYQLTINFNQ